MNNMDSTENAEAGLLKQAVQALRSIGFVQDVQVALPTPKDTQGRLKLKGAWGTATFHVEVKPKLLEAAVPSLAHCRATDTGRRRLLVTSYVAPALGEQLQKHRIEFLDAAGNAYIDRPVYIFVSGKKNAQKPIRLNRALRPAGLRLIYALLKNPTLLNTSQRDLASRAGIALGSVPMILQDLGQRGYLHPTAGGGRSLANTSELLFRWEQGYAELLRPKLFARSCRLAGSSGSLDDLVFRLRAQPMVLLGGELGAARLTKHLRAENATLHITGDEKPIMSSLRLIPDPQGAITLLRVFGTENASNQPFEEFRFADPLLIHAELVQTPGDRVQEISKILLDQYILPRLT